MRKDDFALEITREGNGYIIKTADGLMSVVQDDEQDELKSHEELLWQIMEYFSFGGSKHDEVRLRIVRERRDGKIVGHDDGGGDVGVN